MKFKKKLISATLSLVVATVLMASSSYAWFTISTNPEISKIKTSITANENIEIALDNGYENAEAIDAASAVISGTGTAGNPYTWGNLLDMTTAMTNIGANLSLKPVGYSTKTEGSETKVVMKTPQYGLDGRVAKLVDMAQEYISAYEGVTTPSGGISIFKQTEDTDEADALALSFWLRANADVSLQLSEGTYRADDGTNTAGTVNAESGLGSTLTLTLPQEAIDAAESITDSIYGYLCELYGALYGYCYEPADNRASFVEDWNDTRSSMETLIQQTISEYPLQYEIRISFAYYDRLCEPVYYASLEEISDYLDLTEEEQSHSYLHDYFRDCSYATSYRILPSEQLLRLLNKTRLRFIVTSEEGQQELMAKIVPYVFYGITYEGASNLGSDYYSFNLDGNLVDMSMFDRGIYIGRTYREESPIYHWPGENKFTFKLQFFESDTPGYAELLEAYTKKNTIDDFAARMNPEFYDYGSVKYTIEDNLDIIGVSGHTADELLDAFIEHLTKTVNEEIVECQKALPHIDLSANEAKKVDVYIYLDGEAVTNADAATIDGIDLSLNLQFEKIGGATNAMTGRIYEEEESSSESE